jgi:hypothetical protein
MNNKCLVCKVAVVAAVCLGLALVALEIKRQAARPAVGAPRPLASALAVTPPIPAGPHDLFEDVTAKAGIKFVPFMDEAEGLEWAVKSAAFAFACGATVVSLIPTRPGNGAMERLMESGEFSPPRFFSLEKALELALEVRGDGRIFADTWNLDQFPHCGLFGKTPATASRHKLIPTIPACG